MTVLLKNLKNIYKIEQTFKKVCFFVEKTYIIWYTIRRIGEEEMAKILDMDKKYQIILIVLLLCFVLVVGGAVFTSVFLGNQASSNEDVAYATTDGGLAINYVNGKELDFSSKDKKEYGITITNTTSDKVYYSINLDLKSFSNNFTIMVVDEEDNIVNEVNIDKKFNGKLLSLYSVGANETVRYSLVFKFKNRTSINGELSVINDTISSEVFVDTLLDNLEIKSAQSMVGGAISDTDEGLISTVDTRGTAYYFRGNVKNNYVKIGDYLFRIVRINGDNSIRLVSEDTIGNYAFNTNPLDWTVGVGALANYGVSTLNNELTLWMNTELVDYSNYFVDGDYCIDTDFSYVINESYYNRAYERIYVDGAPMLSCDNKYTGKIGLLSVDEVVYAGAFKNNINKKYYLYNENIEDGYLTLTGLFWNNNMTMINVNSNGSLGDGITVNEKYGIRPVINISAGAKVRGDGTKDNPYVIVDSL